MGENGKQQSSVCTQQPKRRTTPASSNTAQQRWEEMPMLEARVSVTGAANRGWDVRSDRFDDCGGAALFPQR